MSEVTFKGKTGSQVGALPFRLRGNQPEVLLITSRQTARWVIPKGWWRKRRQPHAVAAREAFEEAGIVGRIGRKALGSYRYEKRLSSSASALCKVRVYPLEVEELLPDWPERSERRRRWMAMAEAAECVSEIGLKRLLLSWKPARLPSSAN
jgi:NTP pyrophosphohydrolases including oxidative damage repair enzymes